MQQKALEAAEEERTTLKTQVQELEAKLAKAEEDNKMLVDRWIGGCNRKCRMQSVSTRLEISLPFPHTYLSKFSSQHIW
jgi:hypothetical protein